MTWRLRRGFDPILRTVGTQRPWMRHVESHPRFMSIALHEEPSKAAARQGAVSSSDQNSLAVVQGIAALAFVLSCTDPETIPQDGSGRFDGGQVQSFRERELEEVGDGGWKAQPLYVCG